MINAPGLPDVGTASVTNKNDPISISAADKEQACSARCPIQVDILLVDDSGKNNQNCKNIDERKSRVLESLECRICTDLPRDPMQAECGDLFCKSCLDHHIAMNLYEEGFLKCPSCEECHRINNYYPDYHVRNIVYDTIHVSQCPVKNKGSACSWNGGTLKALFQHEKKDHPGMEPDGRLLDYCRKKDRHKKAPYHSNSNDLLLLPAATNYGDKRQIVNRYLPEYIRLNETHHSYHSRLNKPRIDRIREDDLFKQFAEHMDRFECRKDHQHLSSPDRAHVLSLTGSDSQQLPQDDPQDDPQERGASSGQSVQSIANNEQSPLDIYSASSEKEGKLNHRLPEAPALFQQSDKSVKGNSTTPPRKLGYKASSSMSSPQASGSMTGSVSKNKTLLPQKNDQSHPLNKGEIGSGAFHPVMHTEIHLDTSMDDSDDSKVYEMQKKIVSKGYIKKLNKGNALKKCNVISNDFPEGRQQTVRKFTMKLDQEQAVKRGISGSPYEYKYFIKEDDHYIQVKPEAPLSTGDQSKPAEPNQFYVQYHRIEHGDIAASKALSHVETPHVEAPSRKKNTSLSSKLFTLFHKR